MDNCFNSDKSSSSNSSTDDYPYIGDFDDEEYNYGNQDDRYKCTSTNPLDREIENILCQPISCPVCKEDFSNMPKNRPFTCFKCGYKPINSNYFNNRTSIMQPQKPKINYNENITAADVLDEWYRNETGRADQLNSTKSEQNHHHHHHYHSNRCKCTEKNNKLCAHCRIRVSCQELFNNISKTSIDDNNNVVLESKNNGSRMENLQNNKNTFDWNNKNNNENNDKKQTASTACEELDMDNNGNQMKPSFRSSSTLSKLQKIYGWSDKAKPTVFDKPKQHQDINNKLIKHIKPPLESQSQNNKQKLKQLYQKKNATTRPSKMSDRSKSKKNKRRNKKSRKFKLRQFYVPSKRPKVYNFARHVNCSYQTQVPRNMGWLWTIFQQRIKHFRPGYIPRKIRELMLYFIKPIDVLPLKTISKHSAHPQYQKIEQQQQSTLRIQRINGDYIVTLRPLKDPNSLENDADPYMDMKPIQFKIAQQPIAIKRHKIKKLLKRKGYKSCTCGMTISNCKCRSENEKQRLEKEIGQLSKKMGIEYIRNEMYFSDVTETDSDLDIDFTPPVGLIKYPLLKKPDLIVKETQYNPHDFNKTEPYYSPFKISHPNYKPSAMNNKMLANRQIRIKKLHGVGGGGDGGKNGELISENLNERQIMNRDRYTVLKVGKRTRSRINLKSKSSGSIPKSRTQGKGKQGAQGRYKRGNLANDDSELTGDINLQRRKFGKDNEFGSKSRRKGRENEFGKQSSDYLNKSRRQGTGRKGKGSFGFGISADLTEENVRSSGGIRGGKKLTKSEKEKGWASSYVIPRKPKLKPITNECVPIKQSIRDECQYYNYKSIPSCTSERFVCEKLPEYCNYPMISNNCSNMYTTSFIYPEAVFSVPNRNLQGYCSSSLPHG